MIKAADIKAEITALANPEKARVLARFFKTGKGEYGYGDKFLGIAVPQVRGVAKRHAAAIPLDEIVPLLADGYHEIRLCALLLAVCRYAVKKSPDEEKEKIFRLYTGNTRYINNWDLVDLSAPGIVGAHLYGKECGLLYRYAASGDIWQQRIAMVSTLAFIRRGDNTHTFSLAEKLLGTKEPLIQKAAGWMLREAGKRDRPALEKFLSVHACRMPRTMLRYAIEKFSENERAYYMRSGKTSSRRCSGLI